MASAGCPRRPPLSTGSRCSASRPSAPSSSARARRSTAPSITTRSRRNATSFPADRPGALFVKRRLLAGRFPIPFGQVSLMSVTTRQRQTHSPLNGHPEHAPAASPDLAPPATWYVPARDVLEFGVGLVLLTLAAPVIVLLAALVKLTSRGPAFYSQTRVGKGRRPY